MGKEDILTRSDIEDLIARRNIITIYQGKVLKMNGWIDKHPGGDLLVRHFIGRDASLEIEVHHSDETLASMERYVIGKVELPFESFVPPIQDGVFRTKEQQQAASDLDEAVSVTPIPPSKRTGADVAQRASVSRAAVEATESSAYIEARNKFVDQVRSEELQNDLERYPSLEPKTQDFIIKEFRKLHQQMKDLNMFQCNYWGYFREFCRISLLTTISFYLLNKKWYMLSAMFLGLAWHQLTFCAHDFGHQELTHNYQVDNIVGTIVANFLGGLSLGWWKNNHNIHHVVTNDPVHDPDIQHLPFFSVSTKLFNNVYSTYYNKVIHYDAFAKFLIRFQNYSYYPILCFGRFNLYRLSWIYLLLGQGPRKGKAAWFRYFEIVGLMTWFYWFGYLIVACRVEGGWNRFGYVMISHIFTMPVHAQITLSHFAMSTSDVGMAESFPQRQLRTTMDVECPSYFDYIHGGLQFQAIHHLFPRMPRHNYRQAQPYVIEFCKRTGLEYVIYGFSNGSGKVIDRLADIAKQAKILADVTSHLQEEAFEHIAKQIDKDSENSELATAVERRKIEQFKIEQTNRINAAAF